MLDCSPFYEPEKRCSCSVFMGQWHFTVAVLQGALQGLAMHAQPPLSTDSIVGKGSLTRQVYVRLHVQRLS